MLTPPRRALCKVSSVSTLLCRRWELVETGKRLLLASFFALPFMGHGTLVQLIAAIICQIIFFVLQVYVAPFKKPSDNYWAHTANVMLLLVFFCCIVLKMDVLVEVTEGALTQEMQHNYQIPIGTITIILFFSMLFLLGATLLILTQTLAELRQQPLLRWKSDGTVAEPPPIEGWHALISHLWRTGQDQSRVLKERLSLMLPGVRLFLECACATQTPSQSSVIETDILLA